VNPDNPDASPAGNEPDRRGAPGDAGIYRMPPGKDPVSRNERDVV